MHHLQRRARIAVERADVHYPAEKRFRHAPIVAEAVPRCQRNALEPLSHRV
jgi:hypothetical protein